MTDGLIPTGFQARALADILSQIEAAQRAGIDPHLDTSSESVIGMLNGITATKLRELWELLSIVYAARDPNGATFAALDAVSALTGTARRAATKGSVPLTLSVAAGDTVPAGSIAGVPGSSTNRWVTQSDAYAAPAGPNPASITVQAIAQNAGVIGANAGIITQIVTPVTGWLGVTNVHDAVPGADLETDAELRLRRAQELAHAGGSSLEAIRTTLLELRSGLGNPLLSRVFIDENTSAYADALGRPPHSIEVVIEQGSGASDPGALDLFLRTLWLVKPGGISYYGANVATIIDSQGIARTVATTDPVAKAVWGHISITTDPATYAGDTALKAAWAAYGATLGMGDDVVRMQVARYLLENVPGLLDIRAFIIGLGSDPAYEQESNVSIGPREIASLDTSQLFVVT